MADALGALQPPRQRQKRQRWNQPTPDHQRHQVDRAETPRDDVAHAPHRARAQGQHQRQHRHMAAVLTADQRQPAGGHQQPQHAGNAQSFAQEQRGETQGEKCLGLQDQRRQPWRHAAVHRLKKKGELPQGDRRAIGDQPAPRQLRAFNQQHRREGHQQETQRPQQHRWQAIEADLDDHKVDSPRNDHHQGDQQVLERHCDILLQAFRHISLQHKAIPFRRTSTVTAQGCATVPLFQSPYG
ncbi:hypothetical protein D3C81_1068750 [compost metagenome]